MQLKKRVLVYYFPILVDSLIISEESLKFARLVKANSKQHPKNVTKHSNTSLVTLC